MDILAKIFLYFSVLFIPWLLYQLIKLSASTVIGERTIAKLEDEYAQLLSSRSDLIGHYHWGINSGERDNELQIKRQIVKITKEIVNLRDEYIEKFGHKGKMKV